MGPHNLLYQHFIVFKIVENIKKYGNKAVYFAAFSNL
jgi:hypothetical protein